ncbi:MAG TPA: serine/threonine-protein kinase, partial [Thermoanaerobaculia bacterium]|nr:serine/threonine-protein kinase [Thermoanaerobaculia bacterium]
MEKARRENGELEAGELVAGRYRIVAPLGTGARGEVFAAEDLELGAPVAIKLLLRAASDAGEVAARFRREVLLARRVTHPNVCRIFDLGVHRADGDEAGAGRLFLSMELVRGETLAARLRERGAFDPEEALPLVRQLAAALDAAHAAGVVHRDLKCANVLLEEGPEGTRAVVTDFGLARALEGVAAPPDAPTLTITGGVLGTPAYMSPEQVEGQPAGPASDLYSLGVILYEMVTGALPFPGASPLSAAVRRLREEPPRPGLLRPGLDPLWEQTILRCLARDPAERFRSAGEVVIALTGGKVAPSAPRLARRHRRLAAGAGAVLVALLALAGAWWIGSGPGLESGTRSGMREAVAVLGFRNLTGRPEAAWLSSALAEMLTTEAAAGGHLRAVGGESVARVRLDLGLGEPDALAPETLTRVREQLGADVVVLGGYSALGPDAGHRLRLDLRLQPTRGGEAVLFDVEGTEIELFDLVGRAGARLRQQLGVEPLSSAQDGARRAALPRSAEAARL